MWWMQNISRRKSIAMLAAAAVKTAIAAAPAALPVGAQLYAVRSSLRKDADATLQALAAAGFKDLEGFDRIQSVALAPKAAQHGLKIRSCPAEAPLITNNWEPYPDLRPLTLPEAIDSVTRAGIESLTMGYIEPGARGDGDDFYRRTADRMNAAAELCRKSGVKFAFPNHAFEFAGHAGARPIDIYRERLDPRLVPLELDVFWASVAGEDPLRLLKDWKNRVAIVRLNDKSRDTPRQFEERIGQGAYAEIGSGDIDFAAILKAAPAAGAKLYFLGQDGNTDDPVASLKRGLTALSGHAR
jgi:sugar phosphate isomerase/epimerase